MNGFSNGDAQVTVHTGWLVGNRSDDSDRIVEPAQLVSTELSRKFIRRINTETTEQ